MKIEESDIKVIDFILEQCLQKKDVSLQDLLDNKLIDFQQGEGLEINIFYNPRDEFKRYLKIIESHDLCKVTYFIGNEIVERNSNTSLIINRGGFKSIYHKIKLDEEKVLVDFEKSKIDLQLKKWQKKTFWWIFIIAIIGSSLSIYNFINSLNTPKDLIKQNEKIKEIELELSKSRTLISNQKLVDSSNLIRK